MIKQFFSKYHEQYFNKLIDLIFKYYQKKLKSFVIFGSYATGKYNYSSDIDILLIIKDNKKLSFPKRITNFTENIDRDLSDLEMKLFNENIIIEISPFILYVEEAMKFNPLYLDMLENSIMIYDENNTFKNIMQKTKKIKNKLKSKKIYDGKNWIWNIYPGYKKGEVIYYDQ